MSTKPVNYLGINSKRGPSPGLWGLLDWRSVRDDMSLGYFYETDFLDFPVMATTATAAGPYKPIFDAGNTIALSATATGGVVALTTDGTDNDECYLEFGGGKGGLVKFTKGFGKLAFETTIKLSTVTDDKMSVFIGLCEENAAAANFITDDTGVLTVKDTVGYQILPADGNAFDAIHQTASGALVTVEAATTAVVADTWIKLGIYYDDEETVGYYVNGVLVASCDPDDTNFPDGEEMGVFWGFKNTAAAAATLSIDNFRICQILADNDLN